MLATIIHRHTTVTMSWFSDWQVQLCFAVLFRKKLHNVL